MSVGECVLVFGSGQSSVLSLLRDETSPSPPVGDCTPPVSRFEQSMSPLRPPIDLQKITNAGPSRPRHRLLGGRIQPSSNLVDSVPPGLGSSSSHKAAGQKRRAGKRRGAAPRCGSLQTGLQAIVMDTEVDVQGSGRAWMSKSHAGWLSIEVFLIDRAAGRFLRGQKAAHARHRPPSPKDRPANHAPPHLCPTPSFSVSTLAAHTTNSQFHTREEKPNFATSIRPRHQHNQHSRTSARQDGCWKVCCPAFS